MVAILLALLATSPSCPGVLEGYWQPVPRLGPPSQPGTGTRFECGRVVETLSPGYGWQETGEPAVYEEIEGGVAVHYSGTALQLSKGDMPPPGEAPRAVTLHTGARTVRFRLLAACPTSPLPVDAPMVLRDTAAGVDRCIGTW